MTAAQPTPYQCISPAAAAALIRSTPNVTIFDVRDLASYRLGHVEAAAHLAEDRFLAWSKRLDQEQPVLIYCYKGNASKTYAQMFCDFRFSNVFSVDGGYQPLAEALA
ncbi:thiosulfate sulfurtransferase GlpE [Quatrionicoccus australiensis]|uniref:thiosulfate sulfurtransferase GlpE n=1 Tax=Quatrionicoccus australiensis TaxID=138118 RepID=UPI001CF884D1|nr:thiosulfate sulfurtransferase GlpE [Quatrionicoccus australiensis]UCV16435.1 thiosulfate sulfurtransferase GlpE [Quatrionicoccus australiensis]